MFVSKLNPPACLFLVLLMLSFCLSVFNVSDEKETNKALPVTTLIVNSVIIVLLLLQLLGVRQLANLSQFNLAIFVLVLGLSFILSLTNVFDDKQEAKSFPTVVLVVNSLVLLMVGYQMFPFFLQSF
jgi:cytochrome bd-type quinol oxidase subunit 2